MPVLAGSAAYALGERAAGRSALRARPFQAKAFYGAIAAARLIGVGLNFTPIDPIKALFWSAVINGVVAAPVMAMMMHPDDALGHHGRFTLPMPLRVLGWPATVVMSATVVAMGVSWLG